MKIHTQSFKKLNMPPKRIEIKLQAIFDFWTIIFKLDSLKY